MIKKILNTFYKASNEKKMVYTNETQMIELTNTLLQDKKISAPISVKLETVDDEEKVNIEKGGAVICHKKGIIYFLPQKADNQFSEESKNSVCHELIHGINREMASINFSQDRRQLSTFGYLLCDELCANVISDKCFPMYTYREQNTDIVAAMSQGIFKNNVQLSIKLYDNFVENCEKMMQFYLDKKREGKTDKNNVFDMAFDELTNSYVKHPFLAEVDYMKIGNEFINTICKNLNSMEKEIFKKNTQIIFQKIELQ